MFTEHRKGFISATARDIAQVFFASVFIDPLLRIGLVNWSLVAVGLTLSIFFLILGFLIVK